MTILLKKYIRNLINEISRSKMTDDNPMWQEYQKLLFEPTQANDDVPFLYSQIPKARKVKDFYRKNSDQNFLNGPNENIIAIHSPTAFSLNRGINKYSSYEECKRDMLKYYPCNTIVKHEQSALGIINLKPKTVKTDNLIKKFLKSKNTNPEDNCYGYYWINLSFNPLNQFYNGRMMYNHCFHFNFYIEENNPDPEILTINKGLIPISQLTFDDALSLETVSSMGGNVEGGLDWFEKHNEGDNVLYVSNIRLILNEKEKKYSTIGIDEDGEKQIFEFYLHFSPRRITYAAEDDVGSNSNYSHPVSPKNISFKEYNDLNFDDFLDTFFNELSQNDINEIQRLIHKSMDEDIDNNDIANFEEIKQKNRHLRQHTPSIDYRSSREHSGNRRYPDAHLRGSNDTFAVFDKKDITDTEFIMQNNGIPFLGEIIVGNWQIKDAWLKKEAFDMKSYKVWLKGKMKENNIEESMLQLFYRVRYFTECGIKINLV